MPIFKHLCALFGSDRSVYKTQIAELQDELTATKKQVSKMKEGIYDRKRENARKNALVTDSEKKVRELTAQLAELERIQDEKETRSYNLYALTANAHEATIAENELALKQATYTHSRQIEALKQAHNLQLAELNRLLEVHVRLNEILQTTVDRSTAIIRNGV